MILTWPITSPTEPFKSPFTRAIQAPSSAIGHTGHIEVQHYHLGTQLCHLGDRIGYLQQDFAQFC